MSDQSNHAALQEEKLPFDLRTLMLGLFRRWLILLIFIFVSCILGVTAALKFGEQTYTANTNLLYQPVIGGDVGNSRLESFVQMSTQMGMVKLEGNLMEVRRRLELHSPLEDIEEACKVKNPRGTALLVISSEWNSNKVAASIANSLRDIFLENQQRMRRASLGREVRDLEDRLQIARRKWQSAEVALGNFLSTNELGDPNQNTQVYLDELTSLDQVYQRALVEQEALGIQGADLDKMTNPYGAGGGVSSVGAPGLGGINLRIQKLSQAISEERTHQVQLATFEQTKAEMERAEKLRAAGLISESMYQSVHATYKKQQALMVDSERIKEWKAEIAQVHAEKVKHLEAAREKLKARLDALPRLQRQYAAFSREVVFREAVKKELEERLVRIRQAYDSGISDFTVISKASTPYIPDFSSRKPIALGVAAFGCIMGFVFILGLTLLDTTVKSGSEFSLKLPVPLLGVLPRLLPDEPLFPDELGNDLIEQFRIMARQIRQAVPKKGARILMVSATHGEGTTSVVANLAMCFGRQDERVLLLDAQVRPGEHEHELRDLILDGGDAIKGLGEYLSFETDRAQDIVWPTILPGVECLPRVEEAVIPDLVCSNRMRELLEEVSERFSLVLIDAPPVLPYVDADSLAQWADAIIMVVRGGENRTATLKGAVERLEAPGVEIIGAILNGVDPLYLKSE